MTRALPKLFGVIHLPPLPGSPRAELPLSRIATDAAADAARLVRAGFDGIVVENFGDAPFYADRVPAETTAAMVRASLAVREAAPDVSLCVNVLRNDALSALGCALAADADAIRINVHVGAAVTDQGVIQGRAFETVRKRRELGLASKDRYVCLMCDVAVKHAAPLAARELDEEVDEVAGRGLADAILVTGAGTGREADPDVVRRVSRAAGPSRPVYVASGATAGNVHRFDAAFGFVVGSCLRADGRAGGPIDEGRAEAFAKAVTKR